MLALKSSLVLFMEMAHLQHAGEDPLVPAEGEEVVKVHSCVDDCGSVLPQQGTVLRVQDQGTVEDIQEQHDLIPPGELAGHAKEHLLQQLNPQAFLKSVQTKELFPSCRGEAATAINSVHHSQPHNILRGQRPLQTTIPQH